MKSFIHHIQTLVPEHSYTQEFASERMQAWVRDPQLGRLVRQIYRRSGIDRRYSVIEDFVPGREAKLFRTAADGRLIEPTTEERNREFIRASNRLSVELARRAIDRADGFEASEITHLITVSCTGFYNPGPDYHILTKLGLSDSIERYHIGFMGCYGAFPALRMAQQFCSARPDAVVLVVCLELCSLHLQIRPDPDSLLANALFADGAAAAVVSARPPAGNQPVLALDRFLSAMAPEGKKDMAWEIGNTGFNIVLSSYVPDVIGMNIEQIVDHLLCRTPYTKDDIDLWAIHPGGKAILDRVEKALGLESEQLRASREILRDFGNMSSATVLFVLDRLLLTRGHDRNRICAMAFGPGLTIETGLMELIPARIGSSDPAPIAETETALASV